MISQEKSKEIGKAESTKTTETKKSTAAGAGEKLLLL
jgi:hypothetical protein